MPRSPRLVIVLLALVLAACPPPEEELEPLALEEGCQPLLAGADCLLPYPSDYFLVDDEALPSGKRVEITGEAKPITDEGFSADVADFRPLDGFSTTTPVLAILDAEVDAEGLVGIFDDPAASQDPTSATVIVEADTGRLIPHFTDLDARAEDPLRQALVLHPLVALEEQTRYVVALQGLRGPDGAPIAAPEGFRRLREGRTAQDPALDELAAAWEGDVFAPLEKVGLDRTGLQLAWSFTTGSDEHALADMWRVRALLLEWLADNEPEVTISTVIEDPEEDRWRTVFGEITGPLFLEEDAPGAVLARDEEGRVRINGTRSFSFRAVVPWAAQGAGAPGPAMVFGHGFFGSAAAASDGEYNQALLEEAGAVAFMTDFKGMSTSDVGEVVSTVGGEVSRSLRFGDRVHQGIANQVVLMEAIRTSLLGAEGLTAPEGGPPLYDPDRLSYFGISNGHILGGVLAAVEPAVDRWALQVGGASFSQMMFRALPFGRFLVFLDLRVPDPLDQQKLTAQFQAQFDRFDPARFAPYLKGRALPPEAGPPDERGELRLLMQAGVGDTSVPNFATWMHARLLDVPLMTPSPQTPWGLDEVEAGDDPRAALTIYDFGVDDSFYAEPLPPEEPNPVHEAVRRSPEAVSQTATFLREGRIVHPCEGPCAVSLP